jgi:uncharacterized protein YidB (DUF937 family)
MSSNSSRWIALLGLLAIAGYQNRDKLWHIFGQATGGAPAGGGQVPPAGNPPPSGNASSTPQVPSAQGGIGGGLLDDLRNIFTGGSGSTAGTASPAAAGAGGGLAGSISDILNQFNQAGHGDIANSWVKDGPERQPSTGQLESAIGEDAIDALTKQTGLSRDELLNRLKSILPAAVDQLTPEGRLPTPAEAAGFFGRA